MKKSPLTLLATLALALTGCVVTAVYPFYTPKDVVFEPKLLGKWQEDDPKQGGKTERWVFEKEGETSYLLTVAEAGQKGEVYFTTLFALGKDRFLDLVQTKPQPDGIYVAPHIIMRVLEIGPNLKLAHMKYKWLEKLLEKDPSAVRHTRMGDDQDEDKKLIVLTADTKELQRFIRKHLKTEEAWDELDEMKRENLPK